MVAVLAQPNVMGVLRAGLELLVSWASRLPCSPLSESGRDAMLTPHIVCQTPKGGADFSRSSFPILCVSDRSVFIYLLQSSKKACSSKAEGLYVINSILNVIFQLYSFQSFLVHQ